MKTYLLLRNNRQTGPFTLAEILNEGLRPQDLVWVEGQSASWRYPSELDELRAHVPPPVLDATTDLGFSEVQNRVVSDWTGNLPSATEVLHAPLTAVGAAEADFRPIPIAPPRYPAMPPAAAFKDMSVPAFDALAGLLPDDDLMPTMAWQDSADTMATASPSEKPGTRLSSVPASKPAQVPSPADPPKIRVVLPAAVADKTMVVIRRRDHEGRPVTAPRSRSRRPVLEFLPEEPEMAEVTIPESPQSIPVVHQAECVQAIGKTALAEPGKEPPVGEDALPDGNNIVNASAQQYPAASTLQVRISLVQKIAVITAIISLIAVAVLIANSIFNPDAYQYGNKPGTKKTEQVDASPAQGTVKP